MTKKDIQAFEWVRQVTDTENTRYALSGICFNPKDNTITAANGVAIMRAELTPSFSDLLSKALGESDNPIILVPPKGKLSSEHHLLYTIQKLNSEHVSICGNNFRIESGRFPNAQLLFNDLPKYARPSIGNAVPFVDPYYAAMFFPKRKTKEVAVVDPPLMKTFDNKVYFEPSHLSFKGYGIVCCLVKT